ncbi:MAG: hypothetical protein IKU03_10035 [Bacteroidales bacterium]|nr:hypothetical protein [Bacteroidales bacterium]
MSFPTNLQPPVIKPQRTFILWFMGICSMLDAVFSVCSYLIFMMKPEAAAVILKSNASLLGATPEQITTLTDAMAAITQPQFLMLIGVECLMFAGALLMLWKLNQIGFHLYTIGQLLNICILNFVIGGSMAMNFESIITVVFLIIIYAMQLRYMKRLEDTEESPQDDHVAE